MHRASCQATCIGDQMICESCSLVWDLNDPEPPPCKVPEKPPPAPKTPKVDPWERWFLR